MIVSASLLLVGLARHSAPITRPTEQELVTTAIDRQVTALLAGIPQRGNTLGSPTAPITLQVFGDLQCVNVSQWFNEFLPAIINQFVRTNVIKVQYRAMKTDTLSPKIFVIQQTAALAAGTDGKMWNFLDTFYREHHLEYTNYVTEAYLESIAKQIPGLELAQWNQNRDLSLANSVIADNRTARVLELHDTPAFRIGRSGGKIRTFFGRFRYRVLKWSFRKAPNGELIAPERVIGLAHPLSLIDTTDLTNAMKQL